MNRIEYKQQSESLVDVYMDSRKVGTIEKERYGWRYHVKGGQRYSGELFTSLQAVKNSLEAE